MILLTYFHCFIGNILTVQANLKRHVALVFFTHCAVSAQPPCESCTHRASNVLLQLQRTQIPHKIDLFFLMFSRFCGLIQFQGDLREKVLFQLFLLLCHSFPVVSIEDNVYYQKFYLKYFPRKKVHKSGILLNRYNVYSRLYFSVSEGQHLRCYRQPLTCSYSRVV